MVGTQPMLMQVPPYISGERSTSATVLPAAAKRPARVLPAFPQPITSRSTSIIILLRVGTLSLATLAIHEVRDLPVGILPAAPLRWKANC